VYVYVTSAGSGSYGSLIAYASNRNRSLSAAAVLTLRGPLVMDCEWFLTGGPECSIPEPW
jgi:hypothetical protein